MGDSTLKSCRNERRPIPSELEYRTDARPCQRSEYRLLKTNWSPWYVALGLDPVERRHVLHPRAAVVADPRDVVPIDDAVPVVVLEQDAVQLHVLPGGRRERYPLVLPFLARHPVDGDVGEHVARVLVDVGHAERGVLHDLALEVQRELVRVLVLQVVGDVQRPRGSIVCSSSLIGVSP